MMNHHRNDVYKVCDCIGDVAKTYPVDSEEYMALEIGAKAILFLRDDDYVKLLKILNMKYIDVE